MTRNAYITDLASFLPNAPVANDDIEKVLGQVNGKGALRGYTFQQPIIIDRWKRKTEQHWYPHTEKTAEELEQAVKYIYGTWVKKLWFMGK